MSLVDVVDADAGSEESNFKGEEGGGGAGGGTAVAVVSDATADGAVDEVDGTAVLVVSTGVVLCDEPATMPSNA